MRQQSKQAFKPKFQNIIVLKKKKNLFSQNFSEDNKQFRNLGFQTYFYLFFYPTPGNLTTFWNFGFLSFMFLLIQITTGLFLSMHYVANADAAFESVSTIMRHVEYGWLMRYMHSNGASFFFFLVYMHMARGLYNFSYLIPKRSVWVTGVLIYLLMILTAFTGYVLPWGQMSFWAATVITNLASAVPIFGSYIVNWLWGGYAVGTNTLNRFLSFHYILPFIIFALVFIHVIILHLKGSSNRLGIYIKFDKMKFSTYYLIKDLLSFLIVLIFYFFMIGFYPNVLSHADNFVKANSLVTPAHIVPEWYFLPFYAMLRSVPNKLLGVIILACAIIILFIFPFFISPKFIPSFTKNLDLKLLVFLKKKKKTLFKTILWSLWKYRLYILFWLFVDIVIILGVIGAKPIEEPYYTAGQILTICYFLYFIFLILLFDEKLFYKSDDKRINNNLKI